MTFISDCFLYRTPCAPRGTPPHKKLKTLVWVLNWKVRDWQTGEEAYSLELQSDTMEDLQEQLWDMSDEICKAIGEYFPQLVGNWKLKLGIDDEYLNQTLSSFLSLIELLPTE